MVVHLMVVAAMMVVVMMMTKIASGVGVWTHLPGSLHVDSDDVEAIAAELAGPRAALADPLQQTVLVGVAHRAVAAARVQQVSLESRNKT